MKNNYVLVFLLFSFPCFSQQTVEDNFEGTGTITTWFGDDCGLDTNFSNPFKTGINTSNTVLKYTDSGGTFANVRFDIPGNFELSSNNIFTLKIYIPSNGITGSQTNQVSLKLQDGTLNEPWTTQSEIIKTIVLDQWQTVTFNFANDTYVNYNGSSPAPTTRTDFNRVVIQVNGENNNDHVIAYIDDVLYNGTITDSSSTTFDTLVWSDEFDTNGPVDASKWFHQTLLPNGTSWYNNEVQHYTNRTDNSIVENGILKIIAKKEVFTNQGQTKQYTSARLNSKYAFTYGKVEIRAKMPTGVGTWPAMWMLGQNITEPGGYWASTHGTTPWPACGEVDIVEHWGDNQNFLQSALHTPSSSGDTVNKGGRSVTTASTAFHTYVLEWTSEKMVFKIDGVTHYTYNPATKNSSTWPFDAPQYFLLNVAILPNIDAGFTQSALEIDYIRVYQQSSLSVTNELKQIEALMFPNPVNNQLKIRIAPKFINSSVRVFSSLGKELDKFTMKEEEVVLDMSNYASGLYFLKVQSAFGYKTYQVLKD